MLCDNRRIRLCLPERRMGAGSRVTSSTPAQDTGEADRRGLRGYGPATRVPIQRNESDAPATSLTPNADIRRAWNKRHGGWRPVLEYERG